GRSSKAPDWLDSLGYGRPQETVVDPKVGYATRLYRKPESFNQPWHILYMPAKAPQTRGGAIFEIEGGIWMVALGGYAGRHMDGCAGRLRRGLPPDRRGRFHRLCQKPAGARCLRGDEGRPAAGRHRRGRWATSQGIGAPTT
ncbi:MAG: hypothetical protein MUC99_10070, partial [Anaerolineae bacterium]|nr:hypothetical protein [Anaerolineae bacterium]